MPFWIGFAAAVVAVFVFLCTPRGAARVTVAVALLLSPIVASLVVRLFREDSKSFSIIDPTLAVWAVLFVSVPFVIVFAPIVPILVFGAAFWGAHWKGRYRGAAALLILVLACFYWAWASAAP
jgi:hypothetical protein